MRSRITSLAPIALLVALPLIFFNKTLIGSRLLVSGDFSGSDLLDLNLPFKMILHEHWPKGQLPLWEPRLSLGFPVLAEGQIGAFYPPNILLSFLPPSLGLTYGILIAFILAGLFTYAYARSLGMSRFSSLLAAVSFTFSAFFVTRAKHVNMIIVASWIPFLFWATKMFFVRSQLRFAVLIGVGLALQFLAGHPEMTFFSIFLFSVYFVVELGVSSRKHGFSTVLPFALSASVIAALVAFGLSAIQILPSLEFTGLTEREEFTLTTATSYPFHPKNLVTLISPYYFGNPATGSYTQDIRRSGIFWENASYIGLLPLILAIWAIARAVRTKPRPKEALFFTGFALLSLLLMLGRFTPLYGVFWTLLPGFQLFRFPNRFNVFLILSLAMLAGSGAQLLLDRLEKLRTRATAADGETTRFTWPLKPRATQALIIGFILVDLGVFAGSYLDYLPTESVMQTPEIAERLSGEADRSRIYSLTQYGQSPYAALGWKRDQEAILAIRKAIPPNTNVIHDLSAFNDRSWFEGGLSLKRRSRLENWLLKENQDPVLVGKVLGTYNVRYIIGFAEAIGIEIDKVGEFDLGDQYASTLKLFENKQAIPRALFVPEGEVIKNEEDAFRRLTSLEFLPTKTVILEKDPREIPPQFTGALDTFRAENPVEIVSDTDTEVNIQADIKNHGFLILSDIDYPGWQVEVDGDHAELLPANYLVRAVELDPGRHSIRFFYDPMSFKIGATISSVTLGAILVGSIFHLLLKLPKKNREIAE